MDYEGRQRRGGERPGDGPPRPAAPPRPTTSPVPRPSAPPPLPAQPPPSSALERWLRTPRAVDAPGIYGFGHTPRPKPDPNRLSTRHLLGLATLTALTAAFLWSLFVNGGDLAYQLVVGILRIFLPDSWTHTTFFYTVFGYSGYAVVLFLLGLMLGRKGQWTEVWRRFLKPTLGRLIDTPEPGAAPDDPREDPAAWPELRAAHQHGLADRLAGEVRVGRMNDVDYVRISRAWSVARAGAGGVAAFGEAVLGEGAEAFTHPSGERDLPRRAAPHDLLARQVRIGRGTDAERNPYQHRGSGIALDPALLGTGLLVVGPSGAGKTRLVVRPVAESLCLQALTGQAAVVTVGTSGAELGSADAYDVVIALADPSSRYDLDLYGSDDPDVAAGTLAEALVDGPGARQQDVRRAATALSQVIGPFHAAFGRFPAVPELRELLDGTPHAFAALRQALDAAGAPGLIRELDARERQTGQRGDIAPQLADRIALLDRPAFAGFFDVTGRSRPFTMRALEHPVRVRIDLPAHGHTEAARVLVRLVLAQFTAAMGARRDRSLFACLVLDDAAHAVGAGSVRGFARLRSANAGVVLALRTLDEVPDDLRTALVAAMGCRMVMSGVTTWDGKHFAEAWGTAWVQTRDVTRTPDQSGGFARRFSRGVRKVFTGEAVTTESVTVREVERERWSASDLANSVPAGHAVVSFTTTAGESAPPVLVDLRA
ncbi:ATP-binding protein [Streptomyces sp. NPDC021020]|uniref:ATP-binding protein n=1 Tax=Streptomyces sp. NPDC021020 TaxID=3365109 RepID=UPI0037ACADB0